ncbi:MAG: hypothetical protein R3F61_34060 [Myxococcota bacterium]
MRLPTISVLLLLSISARGSTVLGNPNGQITSVDGDDLYVHQLIAKPCSGNGYSLSLQKTVDEGQHFASTLQLGEHCQLTLDVKWTPSSSLEEVEVTGFDVLDISNGADPFVIELDASNETAVLVIP